MALMTRGLAIASIVALASTIAGCGVVTWGDSAVLADEDRVTEEGINFTSDLVTITAPAGVAESGTWFEVTPSDQPLPGSWSEFATPAGQAIELTLEGGAQPELPITIDFTAVEAGDETFVITETDGEVEILPRDASGGTLVTQTSHLSSFWPITFNVSEFSDLAVETVAEALGVSSQPPACYRTDGLYPEENVYVSVVRGNVAWPCVTRDGDSATLELHANSGVAWTVETSPAWTSGMPTSMDLVSSVTGSTWRQMGMDEGLLLPGATTELATRSFEDTQVTLEINAGLTQVQTVSLVLGLILPDKIIEKMSRLACASDLLEGSAGGMRSGDALAAIASCLASVAEGVVGELVGLMADGAGAFWSQVEGATRSGLQESEAVFDVAEIPEDSNDGEPIDRAEVEGLLGRWAGPIDQPGSRDYTVDLSLVHDGRTVTGVVAYPELTCSGYLHAARMEDGALRIQETINRNSSCVEEVGLKLEMEGDRLSYYFGPDTDQRSEGTGLLVRTE